MSNKPYHIPVLCRQVIEYMQLKPGNVYVDVTFGGGGHTKAMLDAQPECQVVALDWDTRALEINGYPLQEQYSDRLTLLWGNFAYLDNVLKKAGIKKVDGILADFGTSQYQLLERDGFSFNTDTPLDMRMSPAHQTATAADILNKAHEDELLVIFKSYGQEPRARALVRAIVEQRKKYRFKTTQDLVKVVVSVVGYRPGKKIHPATQAFQALRIAVNQELNNIRSFLHAAVRILPEHGRLVCIAFHSLEDGLVKDFFKEQVMMLRGEILTPKAIVADEDELKGNPSSRSARLRALKIIKKV